MVLLKQGQQEAADGFFEFLVGDEKEMIISGPAGVGKTFLLGHLIHKVIPMYSNTCKILGIDQLYNEVTLTATTNKSAEVLSSAANLPVSTIQSFLNLRVQDDFSTGRSKLTKTNSWHVHERKIIFVEECSMIDSILDQMIQEGTHECKIVYVGDRCQLAPVMETLSPIYRRGLRTYDLREFVRNAGQPVLMDLCKQARLTVETGEFHPVQIVPGIVDWVGNQEMESMIQEAFSSQTDENRILAFTNQRVHDYNDHIRGVRNLPDQYQKGERLINSTSIRIKDVQISVEEPVTILDVQNAVTPIVIYDGAILDVTHATIQTKFGGVLYDVPLPVDREHYHNLLKYFGKAKNWSRYFFMKNTFPDLRPSDASTFHKAQGSTYDTVFIDAGNLSTCHIQDMVARMLYVAVSRARNRVVFYGHLASKYGGFIQ